jgi:uncharacterized tellurite resistance protein B-like protein
MVTDDERRFLGELMTELGLTLEEREAVVLLQGLDEAVGIVQTLSVDDRRDLLARLVDAASADGRMSHHELATVKRVAAALGIDQS